MANESAFQIVNILFSFLFRVNLMLSMHSFYTCHIVLSRGNESQQFNYLEYSKSMRPVLLLLVFIHNFTSSLILITSDVLCNFHLIVCVT